MLVGWAVAQDLKGEDSGVREIVNFSVLLFIHSLQIDFHLTCRQTTHNYNSFSNTSCPTILYGLLMFTTRLAARNPTRQLRKQSGWGVAIVRNKQRGARLYPWELDGITNSRTHSLRREDFIPKGALMMRFFFLKIFQLIITVASIFDRLIQTSLDQWKGEQRYGFYN